MCHLIKARGISAVSALMCAVFIFTAPDAGGLILSEEGDNALSSPSPGGLTRQPSVARTDRQPDPAAGNPNRNAAPGAGSISAESDASYFAVALVLFFLVFSAFSASVIFGVYRRRKTRVLTRRKVRAGNLLPSFVAHDTALLNTAALIEQGRLPMTRSAAEEGVEMRPGAPGGPRSGAVRSAAPRRRGTPHMPPAKAPAAEPFCRVVSPLSRKIL